MSNIFDFMLQTTQWRHDSNLKLWRPWIWRQYGPHHYYNGQCWVRGPRTVPDQYEVSPNTKHTKNSVLVDIVESLFLPLKDFSWGGKVVKWNYHEPLKTTLTNYYIIQMSVILPVIPILEYYPNNLFVCWLFSRE